MRVVAENLLKYFDIKLSNIHFVLLAAGKSTRFKSKENKLLSKLEDKTILEHNIEQIKK